MGKKNKKSKTSSEASPGNEQTAKKMESKKQEAKERVITMKALREMSDSDSDGGELPPEEEWDADAKALRDAIEGGVFEKLLKNSKKENADDDDDDASIEEVVLDDNDNEEEDSPKAQKSIKEKQENHDNDDDDDESSSAESVEDEEEEEEADDKKEHVDGESNENNDNDDDDAKKDSSEDENDDEEEEEEEEEETTFSPFNKGLAVVTQELQAAKRHLPWVETFDIVPKTPLPFEAGTETALDIHDDLKREVAFYDMALEAVQEAKTKCEAAKLPFTRPDDFFAEMVKTDEHITKIKDRLIFETKKMDAVAQRKSNKEQKLRAKEAHNNKLLEKAKRKKDHFKAVEDWAASAESKRGKNNRAAAGVDDEAFLRDMNKSGGETNSNNGKKRMRADEKFGFGGKRGRFKTTDPSSLNDSSSFNRKGNFAQGMKKSPGSGGGGAGGSRQGKRARDATRARRN